MPALRSLRKLLIAAALLGPACGTCGSDPASSTSEPESAATAPADPRASGTQELFRTADARRLTDPLREGLRDPDPAIRRAAALAVSRLHDPAAVPILVQALRDPDAEVRRNASLGLGAMEDEAPAGVPQALLAALAAEEVAHNRGSILWDLSRVAGEEGLPALREGMAANEPEVRAAACRGLGFYGLRSRALEPALLRRIAARMVDDADPAVRLACSYALTRLAPPVDSLAESGAIVEDLGRALQDQDADVRAMAVRALGRYPGAPVEAIAARTADEDWQVAVQAFRALGRAGSGAESAYARALRARLDRALARPADLHGPELHVLLAAFEAAAPFARGSAVHGVATEALARIAGIEGDADRDRGLAHCGAATLVDRGRGWPTRLQDGCGMGKVSDAERQVAMAEVLRDLEGAQAERLALLERLYRGGDARVRQAVLAAAAGLEATPVAELVLGGLASDDPGVVTTALDTLAGIAPKWRAEAPPEAAAPVLSVRPAGAPLPEAQPTEPGQPGPPPPARVEAALRGAWEVLRAADEVEGLQSWARAVAATESRALGTELGSLGLHSVAGVRRTAREALEALGAPVPEGEVPAPANVIELDSLPADRELGAVVTTTRGERELELLPGEAPTTVARFVALARDGFFDGLAFHRVVPAFVIQGGDPRGDGYGGPGWTQRCEDNRVAYRRGTLGMALAGRDTGGSQFFIAHGPQPHLDGRYTAFGRVVRGMDVVDELQVGDRIRSVDVLEARVEGGPE